MRKSIMLAIAAMSSLSAIRADAQLFGLERKIFGLPADGVAGGRYQSHDRIRVFVSLDYFQIGSAKRLLIAKAAALAEARGFERIGITKARCMTAVVLGRPRSTACYLIATMLHGDDIVAPHGADPVEYITVATVLSGAGPAQATPAITLAPVVPAVQPRQSTSYVRSPTPRATPRSAAEDERARLQAAAATDGDPRQGVTVR